MFEVTVFTRRGLKVDSIVCAQDECAVGKDPECLITLHGWKVAKKHARLLSQPDGVYVRDLGTSSGTYVNGTKVEEYGPLKDGDEIAIHSYRIRVGGAIHSAGKAAPSVETPPTGDVVGANGAPAPAAEPVATAVAPKAEAQVPVVAESEDTERLKELTQSWRRRIHKLLIHQLDLRRLNTHEMGDDELRRVATEIIESAVDDIKDFPSELDKGEIIQQVINEAVGLGPLEELLAQDDITEIMVNCADEIYYEKAGRLYKSDITFTSDKSVTFAIERIVAPLGRRIDESSPMVDARLKDGSRVNAVIPPLALKGPCITIRKFSKDKLEAHHLVKFGSLSEPMVRFLETAVTNRSNIVISGGTGSGKTTLLNVLSNFIPNDERIITVEDAAELQLYQPNLISLEARPPNQEGKGAVSIRELIKNCLRMRPDRIVVGECRSGEALDMLQAMNTGHDGSLTTAHANSPRDCMSRLEVMVMMAGMDLPVIAIREQIASAVDLVVQQTRFSCGTRVVTSISEVTGVENSRVQMGEIFRFEQSGYDADGKVRGKLVATGHIPALYEDLRDRGIPVDLEMFQAGAEH